MVPTPTKQKPRLAGLLRDGRYWARTSDPQLVELVLTARFAGTSLAVGKDLGKSHAHEGGFGRLRPDHSRSMSHSICPSARRQIATAPILVVIDEHVLDPRRTDDGTEGRVVGEKGLRAAARRLEIPVRPHLGHVLELPPARDRSLNDVLDRPPEGDHAERKRLASAEQIESELPPRPAG
jgi:hypothetical protein